MPLLETSEDSNKLLNLFESIDEDIRDKDASKFYFQLWKVALDAGKLSLANSYAKKALNKLVELKRIPQIKTFIKTLNDSGLFKKKNEEYKVIEEILLGKRNNISDSDLKYLDLFLTHPEHWKESREFLKQYLLLDEDWDQEMWKLCYEFILINHFDKDIFILLLNKSRNFKNKSYEKNFTSLLKNKNIRIIEPKTEAVSEKSKTIEKLNVDYDQIAMDLLSGAKEPSHEEQRRVINSLKFITDEELSTRGQEMIMAFELLGMEEVVLLLCERIIKTLSDVKLRASTYFVWAQALMNSEEHYKAIDLIDEVLETEPLYGDEILAFYYLKAEACLKLRKFKLAKELYMFVKKQNPHYRLVRERLRTIEAT